MLLGHRPSPAAMCSHLAGSLGSWGRGGCPGPWHEAGVFVPVGASGQVVGARLLVASAEGVSVESHDCKVQGSVGLVAG